MNWSKELSVVYQQYETLGKRLHTEMYQSWQSRQFPLKAWQGFARLGFFRAVAERGLPGALPWCAAALEGFCNGAQDGAFTIAPVCHGIMSSALLLLHASSAAQARYAAGLADGSLIAAFAVTERKSGGTDCFNPQSRLKRHQNNTLRLSGSKWHITNAPNADLIVAWAKEEETEELVAVLVERTSDGVHVGKPLSPVGARTSPVAGITFDNVLVPECNVVRFPKGGKTALQSILMFERTLVPFPCLALMDVMLEKSLSFALGRKVRNKSIATHQHIQRRLTDMAISIREVRALAHAALNAALLGQDTMGDASILKIVAPNAGIEVANNALKLCATEGFQEQAQLQMMLLDLMSVTIGGGTEEAHRTVVFGELLKARKKDSRGLWIKPARTRSRKNCHIDP